MRIEIVDNFLSKEDQKMVSNAMIFDLRYNIASSKITEPRYNFMHGMIDFISTNKFDPLIKSLLALPNVIGEEIDIIRMYSNMAPAGEWYSGDFHQDDGTITALYYPVMWNSEWGGGTSFITGEVVDNVRNRLVLFDAAIPHKGDPHTHEGWRYTIAIKTNLRWADNETSGSK